jgi:MFS family permease
MPSQEPSQELPPAPPKKKSPLMVVFTTVCMDLVGFGIIIPLLPLYGQDFGANEWTLPLLVAAYSLAQFFFAPLWGQISDRHGRRGVMLVSMTGSTLSYLGFALATGWHSLPLLMATRFLQGACAANISAASACIADVTPANKRAHGMALIGIAFGVGFILGPLIGGVSLKYFGMLAPGLIAGGLCGLNLLAAWSRLPETLPPEIKAANQAEPWRRYDPLNTASLFKAVKHPYLWLLLLISFLQLTAFSTMEQVFSLFFKAHLRLSLADAGLKTGYALAFVGFVAAVMQGGLTRRLAPKFGERRMLVTGIFLFAVMLFVMPFGPTYGSYFIILFPLAVGRSLIDPSMSSLISQAVSANEQGRAFGTFQGLNSLARVAGPAVGLWLFYQKIQLPFLFGGALTVVVLALCVLLLKKTRGMRGVDATSLTGEPA